MEYTDNRIPFNYKKRKPKMRSFCYNCGKSSHLSKQCKEPCISYGIILFYPYQTEIFLASQSFKNKLMKNYLINTIQQVNDNQSLLQFDQIKEKITNQLQSIDDPKSNEVTLKYLLILDRHTPDYVQIIKGNYSLNDVTYLKTLISRLTHTEVQLIEKHDLQTLFLKYSIFSNKNALEAYKDQYLKSNELFTKLKKGTLNDQYQFVQFSQIVKEVKPDWNEPNWGFPKGRRRRFNKEKDLECAMREFKEETGIDNSNYDIITQFPPLEEMVNGSDGKVYKHVYYLAKAKSYVPLYLNPYNKLQLSEIRKIGWFTYEEALEMIREYQISKKNILTIAHDYCTQIIKNID